ncbi:bifunctional diaminohydroxyphosphoribosylaminopyrimidine deaminase/5-amino-6-(5-phosphoribosylamino)uracil reductase RibD [Sulfitobacter sp. F26169L]|uniref:bifunctional diaminohydroxyphosphoribosylaminopyrimidine deaminase/5-amino-6-(5-phosphoribosylamino)uracil reductase RibD n=1 Tax=Sulfitobacter sp. F26169L TaxID=2996015 RepID=UPI0022609BE3|nr:bifunctional diaminohydroxyphosphoribosylaminopyrimidine deaminase/5-amino-6-(5-phosphoribosylamino)uracil reductase RibD [Sulfitobacter sp. F26169L]MCX7566424.1 bifunctional diaminohydroxyphosphoribosylaminopyrimidine deaminase/5-amino-6-(5-phosphoribosylamino)uracil reductase RibD [Sulfitobacter sp. F26169L]
MDLALSLGRRGLGTTWPNPAVGCVIVRAGHVVGRGWTAPSGRPHAETQALAQAGEAAKGADVFVTLEPCAHHGQTPPCAQALIDAGVARVVVAVGDSDGRVAGRGLAMLRDAGIEVVTGPGEAQARADNIGFFSRVEQGRPMVTLKLASSFDGRIATATGESKWITQAPARRLVHAMRSRHDAVMVGGGTVRADDPSLDVRDLGVARQPARVVVSRHLDIPLGGKLAQTATKIPLILCHGADAPAELVQVWKGLGAVLLPCAVRGGQLDMGDVLHQLGAHGLTRVFSEGGSAIAASLLKLDLVDFLVGFTAGMVIGAEGVAGIGAMGLGRLTQAPRFNLAETQAVGPDVMHTWVRNRV